MPIRFTGSRLRQRLIYLLLLLVTLALGMVSRRFPGITPGWILLYAGDTLWALMVFWMARMVFPRHRPAISALAALLISYAIELSQFYHSPWIDHIRATPLGGLVLGFGFLWSDMVCYTAGVLLGLLIDGTAVKRK